MTLMTQMTFIVMMTFNDTTHVNVCMGGFYQIPRQILLIFIFLLLR